MYQLHFYIMENWIFNNMNKYNKEVKYLIYAGHYQGYQNNLTNWKEKLLFEPINLFI